MIVRSSRLLIATDLDRTLLPNGGQPESAAARPMLRQLVGEGRIGLAYVSGRSLGLVLEAVPTYDLPMPDWIIADVGATIYHRENDAWERDDQWHALLSRRWQGKHWQDVLPLVSHIGGICLQAESAQGDHKLSFDVAKIEDRERVMTEMESHLDAAGLAYELIWSVDETVPMGLIDVMASGATKLGALQWLVASSGTEEDRVLYAGDSGNDLPVLTSDFASVLVANATDEVKAEALRLAAANGCGDRLYLARGDAFGMNGNYAAGIIEGLAHFFPETLCAIEAAAV
ncbi:MAG: HAD-IIB family hydrolase [Verrucomicrobiaceae bacterium]|nr:HAD-IIB family hydrolase [Verrucomicrobiaceae bacterium]